MLKDVMFGCLAVTVWAGLIGGITWMWLTGESAF
jgi:hypothetical protein